MVPGIELTAAPDSAVLSAVSLETPGQTCQGDVEQSESAEWPRLASFEGIDEEEVSRTEWRKYNLPAELEQAEADVSEELRAILRDSLDRAQHPERFTIEVTLPEPVPQSEVPATNQRPVSIASSDGVSDSSSSENMSRNSSISSNPKGLNLPGNPSIKMGPLGWIITYPDGKPKKSKKLKDSKPKERKEDHGLKKFLKEKKAERANGECVSCMEDLPNKKLIAVGCAHKYCSTCFIQLVATSMQNEAQFPPKCCLTEVPIKTVLSNVSVEQKEAFKLKAQEYAVPANNRWYCPSTTCLKWIPLDKIKNRANDQKCPHCRTNICGICRGNAHATGEDCPQDFGLEATLDEAERAGWRRCYRCKAMVELTVGCRHITCKCKAEFCYTCGAVWKTCACTEVDQARRQQELLDRRAAREQEVTAREREAAAEAAEVAAAIAAVERQEREEAEARERFEQEIREEEERRRQAEEEATRRREQERVHSIKQKAKQFLEVLGRVHKRQREALIARHMKETQQLHADIQSSGLAFTARTGLLRMTLRQNLKARIQSLQDEQNKVLETLSSRHDEEEDELFVRMTSHLRGKPNREAREKSMTERLKQQQQEEQAAIEEEHRLKREELEWMGGLESKSLEDGMRLKREEEVFREGEKVAVLVRTAWAERKWFETVSTLRGEMVQEWQQQGIRDGLDLSPRQPEAELESPSTPVNPSSSLGSSTGDQPTTSATSIESSSPRRSAEQERLPDRDPLLGSKATEWPLRIRARNPNVSYAAHELNSRVARVY